MPKIEAIIRPERISQVTEALLDVGCSGFHYQNVTGQGQQQGVKVVTGRGGQLSNRSAVPKTVLTTIIPESMQEKTIDAIIQSARTPDGGQIGDGKIFISNISDVIRVRTGENGEKAI
jgi:nitrogen regulatory protein PII